MRVIRRRIIVVLLVALAFAGSVGIATAAPSPVLDFDFTEGSGPTLTDSANGIVGTTHGTAWAPAPGGTPSLLFNEPIRYWFGDGDYFAIPDHAALDAPHISIEADVWPAGCGYYTVFVERVRDGGTYQCNLYLGLEATGYTTGTKPFFELTIGGVPKAVASPVGIPLYAWSHIVGTYDGNAMKIYVDGILMATESGVGGPRDGGSNPLYVGHAPTGNHYFQGFCSSFKMYARALTAEEIATDAGVPPVADANGPYTGSEGIPVELDGSASSDPKGGVLEYAWDLDNDGEYDDATGISPSCAYADDGSYGVGLRVTDFLGATDQDYATITIGNVAPTLDSITAPVDPVPVGSQASVSVAFTDPGIADTHTAAWDWGDGTTAPGDVAELAGSGTATGQHTYAAPGVYRVIATVTDKDGGTSATYYDYIVVYDPSSGFVTGGGWIQSPTGAYVPSPDLSGKASFGFVSKYKKGAVTPSGATEFVFQAAGINFHSDTQQWLVVNRAGSNAQFKCTGTIDGEFGPGSDPFDGMIWAGDGIGPDGSDTFRIKLWYTSGDGSEVVVYDNLVNQRIAGGSIVLHAK